MAEKYELMGLFDRLVLFTDGRFKSSEIPEGMYRYSLRHGDDDSYPCTVEEQVIVNHYGDIITDRKFEFPEGEHSLPVTEDDWGFCDASMTIKEFVDQIDE